MVTSDGGDSCTGTSDNSHVGSDNETAAHDAGVSTSLFHGKRGRYIAALLGVNILVRVSPALV